MNQSRVPIRGFSDAFRLKDFAVVADWFAIYFFLVGGAGILLAGIAAGFMQGFPSGIRVFALSAIFSGACATCGWVLGLLFGIPRTLARPQLTAPTDGSAGKAAPSPATSRVNTNLEDVSDWLTKTLIGVGLTQLYLVPNYLWSASAKINQLGFAWPESGQLLALSLFLYSTVGGFWLGYIATRTVLTKLLDSLEGPVSRDVEIALSPDQLKLDLTGKEIAPSKSAEVAAADRAMLQLPIYSLSSARQLAAWGAAKARSGDLSSATLALEQATLAEPSETTFKEALAKIYRASNRSADADKVLQGIPDSETAMLGLLYDNTMEAAEKVVEIGRRLSNNKEAEGSLNLHVWLACAYGQIHNFAIAKDDSVKAEEARKSAISEVGRALSIDPTAKAWLRALWKPAAGSTEDDLASIPADDVEMGRLLSE